jgi:abequosyltransferase
MNDLSIVIPTHNRAKFLDFLLKSHIEVFRQFSIHVFIYNNASTDDTEQVINKWKEKYHLISSKTNIDDVIIADKSIENALKLSNTKYRWLLVDTYYLSPELVQHVSNMVAKNNETDFYILNLNNLVTDIPSSSLYEENLLLSNFSTILACVGCQIYNEKIINSNNFNKYTGTNYVQLGIILEYINNNNFCANWVQELSVTSLESPNLEKRNWSHGERVLEVAAKNWTKFIFSLPDSYSTKSKLMAIKNFGRQTNIFTIKGLLLMRVKGNLTYVNYKKYSKEIGLLVKYPLIVVIISVTPILLLKAACIIFTRLFRRNKTKLWCFHE